MKSRFPTNGEVMGRDPQVDDRDPQVDELLPRRTFLVRFGATVAAVGAGVGCGPSSSSDDGLESTGGSVNVGNIQDVPIGHLARIPGRQLVLGRDTEGLYALSTICTHLGCDMAESGTVSASGLTCDCHGSRFAPSGAVLAGPATAPLTHYKVDLSREGAITVQPDAIVASTVRTPVVT